MICKIFFLCFVGSLEPCHVCSTFILPPNGLGNMYFREVLCWYIRPDKPGTPSSRVSQILSMFCLSCQLYCLGSIISEVQLTQGGACYHSCDNSQLWVRMCHHPAVPKDPVFLQSVVYHLLLLLSFQPHFSNYSWAFGGGNVIQMSCLKARRNASTERESRQGVPSDKLPSTDSCWERHSQLSLRVHRKPSVRRPHIYKQSSTQSWMGKEKGGSGRT